MIITNILLTILVLIHLKNFTQKNKIDIFTTKNSYELLPVLEDIELLKQSLKVLKKDNGGVYKERLIKLHSMYKEQINIVKNDLYANEVLHKEKFLELHSMYKEQIKCTKDDLDAHKVFTAKSLSELKEEIDELNKADWKDKIIFSDNPKWKGGEFNLKEFFNQYGCKEEVELKPNKKTKKKLKAKKNKLKYTDFKIDKEILRYFKGLGSKWAEQSKIKDVKNKLGGEYPKQKSLAYHRLWQRQNYKSKNK
tara:strand:- start:2902 stop:3654 length:753 start_codon:yes stop_codon:yes gene_type:complete